MELLKKFYGDVRKVDVKTVTQKLAEVPEQAQAMYKKGLHKARKIYHNNPRKCLLAGVTINGLLLLKSSFVVYRLVREAQRNAFFRSLEKDVVHLFMTPRWSHGPNPFAYCVKIETFLRLAKIPYVVHFTNDSSLSPNGKLPFIVHNDLKFTDSEFIMQYLYDEFNVTMNEDLSPENHAKGLLIRRLVELSLNYGLNRCTFVDHPKLMADMFAKEYHLDPIIATMLVNGMRSATIEALNGCMYGNLSNEVYETELLRDVQAVETLLRDGGEFICGHHPSTYDCSLYAWLQVASQFARTGSTLTYISVNETFKKYIRRMSALAFPDMDRLTPMTISETTQRFVPVEIS